MIERKVIKAENVKEAEQCIYKLLELIGEDSNREGLQKTPYRIIKSYEELYEGYTQNPKEILNTTFESDADEMVLVNNIEFWSTCEHHALPFRGKTHIGYIPNGRVVGVSKLVRLTNCFARRLQIQENMTSQIANSLMEYLKPKGVGVVVEAEHQCMKARGVKNPSSYMVTSKLLGDFKEQAVRNEFLHLIEMRKK